MKAERKWIEAHLDTAQKRAERLGMSISQYWEFLRLKWHKRTGDIKGFCDFQAHENGQSVTYKYTPAQPIKRAKFEGVVGFNFKSPDEK